MDFPLADVSWPRAHRLLPSRYPPVDLFERIAPPEDWEALAEIESLTNDRLRQEIGDIALVPAAERLAGPGASAIMAAFTHVGHPSRFTDGRLGVYYAAEKLEGAIAEVSFHQARFLARTSEPPLQVAMRCYITTIVARFHDVREHDGAHDPDSYAQSQAVAAELRARGSDGIVYRNVRSKRFPCDNIAAFRPRAAATPNGPPHSKQGPHFFLQWDGNTISRYFEAASAASQRWQDL